MNNKVNKNRKRCMIWNVDMMSKVFRKQYALYIIYNCQELKVQLLMLY